MFYYHAFGLNIASSIRLPELSVSNKSQQYDITINWGKIAAKVSHGGTFNRLDVSMDEKEYILKINGIANYYVSQLNSITVESFTKQEKEIRLFLWQNAIPAVLNQIGKIPLRASAIFIPQIEGAVLIAGHSNAGKTSLISKLSEEGARILADDMVVLELSEKKEIFVLPGSQTYHLWEDTIKKLGWNIPHKGRRIRRSIPKYQYQIDDPIVESQPVRIIILIERSNLVEHPQIFKLDKQSGFTHFYNLAYKPCQVNDMNKKPEFISAITALTQDIPIYKILRPEHINSLSTLPGIVQKILLRESIT